MWVPFYAVMQRQQRESRRFFHVSKNDKIRIKLMKPRWYHQNVIRFHVAHQDDTMPYADDGIYDVIEDILLIAEVYTASPSSNGFCLIPSVILELYGTL